ncbi:MAG: hypothetical protein P0119_16400 [Nitrospira sp.]|nr:hypothetical protein [Nitrospira sp.]
MYQPAEASREYLVPTQANIAILESVTAGSQMRKARAKPGRSFAHLYSTRFAVATAKLMRMNVRRHLPVSPSTTGANVMLARGPLAEASRESLVLTQANIAILELGTAGSRMRKAPARPGRSFAQTYSPRFAVATAKRMRMNVRRHLPVSPSITRANAVAVVACFSEHVGART